MNYPELEKAIAIVEQLRDPVKGCPWDLKQTHQSLLKYLIEESYEYLHAVENQNSKQMMDELGDVLLQILLHATIATESGDFTLEDVAKNLHQKLIHRHPHVFKKREEVTTEEVLEKWEKLKGEEKKAAGEEGHPHTIDESLLAFPALFSADKIGKKTHQAGFDWSGPEEVLLKVREEWEEMQEELRLKAQGRGSKEKLEEELGDLLFTLAQFSRHLDFRPEETLRKANRKFLHRYQLMLELVVKEGKDFSLLTPKQKERYWQQAKKVSL